MVRRGILLALVAAAAAGCNEYNFSPVGHCLLQPGSVRVQLSKVSSADVLFVVDDSPSMDPKQDGLAASFKDFITRMVQANTARAARGLDSVDFRIAVTTTSVFWAGPNGRSCVAGSGGNQCCRTSACTDVTSCTPGTAAGCGNGQVCVTTPVLDADGLRVTGSKQQCCAPSDCTGAAGGCAPGDACTTLQTAYSNPFPSSSFCTPGYAVAGAPYPGGALVSAPGNPRILDFSKDLDWASWGTASQDGRLTQLVQQFAQNIKVGSCGSGQEQGLEAGRLALQKALAGQLPGVAPGTFPRPGAKLVVVWVGDEDDCSSPAGTPVPMATSTPGADACVLDKHQPAGAQREIPVSDYASFFASLVRADGPADLGAAFIVSSVRCADGTYAAADSCSGIASCPVQPPLACHPAAPACGGAFAAGERFLQLGDQLRARGIAVVEGTVCDAYPPSTFGPVLSAIADLARPLDGLRLPTLPAARAVTNLRIADGSGTTRRTCAYGTEWCFVGCEDPSPTPACLAAGTSQCIAIDPSAECVANPGETYAAEYLGTVPAGGCANAGECAQALGGKEADWACQVEPGASRGSCACAGNGG
jgi:hypothetical protein